MKRWQPVLGWARPSTEPSAVCYSATWNRRCERSRALARSSRCSLWPVEPLSAASKIRARVTLRTACLPPLRCALSSLRSAWRVQSVESFVVPPNCGRGSIEPDVRTERAGKNFTPKPTVPFIHAPTPLYGRPPAEADMQVFRRQPIGSQHGFGGFMARQGGVARSIKMRIDPQHLLR
jgi:hypothetical protein